MIVMLPNLNIDTREDQLDNPDTAGYTVLLPGKNLDISAIIKAKNSSTGEISQLPWKPVGDLKKQESDHCQR